MKIKNRLFGRKTNRYFNYKIGAFDEKRSAFSVFFVNFILLAIFVNAGAFGYMYYHKSQPVLARDSATTEVQKVEELTQEQIDEKSLQAREDSTLVDIIENEISKMPATSEWQVSLRDLNSGRMANVNSDELMPSASFYKLFLLAPLEKKISAENWKSYVGSQSINDCVTAMIKVSDNDCPYLLGNYINWRSIDPYNQTIGFKQTTLSGGRGTQATTAREVNDLMYRLQNSQILSDKARRLVFDALYAQVHRQGIPAGCGDECLVANKTGELDGYLHDAAIVTHGRSKYVLVIMSKGASWSDLASLAKSIDREMLP